MIKMVYGSKRVSEESLEKVVGGSFTDILRDIGCFMGVCDSNQKILVGMKTNLDRNLVYRKYKCPRCGKLTYSLETITSYGPNGANGYYSAISASRYENADAPINLLAI